MTLSTTDAIVQYSGDGSTVSFSTVFKFLANADVQITHRDSSDTETVWVEGTQYSLTGAGVSSGGTVTVKTSPTDYTPASGETITIERITTVTQGTAYPEGGAFPAAAHETALDRLTMITQQIAAKIGRALKFPVTDASMLSGEIPNSTDRASKFLAFDSAGEPIASSGPTGDSSIPVSSYIETLLDDANAAAARATLAAAALAANTFTGTQTLGSGASIAANDKVVGKAELKDYAETLNDIGSTGGGTQDIDLELGNTVRVIVDTSANTFTFSNAPASGRSGSFTMRIRNGGSQTVTWPGTVDWVGGTAPTLTTAGDDVFVFITFNGGAIWYGFAAGLDLS